MYNQFKFEIFCQQSNRYKMSVILIENLYLFCLGMLVSDLFINKIIIRSKVTFFYIHFGFLFLVISFDDVASKELEL